MTSEEIITRLNTAITNKAHRLSVKKVDITHIRFRMETINLIIEKLTELETIKDAAKDLIAVKGSFYCDNGHLAITHLENLINQEYIEMDNINLPKDNINLELIKFDKEENLLEFDNGREIFVIHASKLLGYKTTIIDTPITTAKNNYAPLYHITLFSIFDKEYTFYYQFDKTSLQEKQYIEDTIKECLSFNLKK